MAESKDFFEDFIEDYYAECAEHLAVVRRDLLALESRAEAADLPMELIDELFRSFHTLKGLSAMVGLKQAEELAHGIESYLSGLKKSQVAFSPEAMEALAQSVVSIEDVIAAHRRKADIPDVSPLLERLRALPGSSQKPRKAAAAPVSAAHGLGPEESRRVAKAVQNGARVWRFEFTPDQSLVERGVNVNMVRARLKEIGDLIRAKPEVAEAGKIKFEFLVATDKGEEEFQDLTDNGVTHAPYEVEPPPASPAEQPPARAKPEGERTGSHPISSFSSNVVRVDLGKLDDLMRMVGELVIVRARLEDGLRQVESVMPGAQLRNLQDIGVAMERQLRGLREGIMRVRMVPVQDVFERMRFVARDLAREYGKSVEVEVSGGETEIDKYLVERMLDPLLHLVRNAVSHGLEPEAERRAQGKPPAGKLTMRAAMAGETGLIEVMDDGRGIDAEGVVRKAERSGLLSEGETLDRAGLLRVISESGFSTLAEADLTSGRGIGMAVVKNAVRDLGGDVTLDTRVGRGTRFTISLPLTLSIAEALIVSVGGQTYAIPLSSVLEILEVEPSLVTVLENNEIIPYRDGALPLIRFGRLFHLEESPARLLYAVVLGDGFSPVGLVVDRLLGQREIVIRSLDDPLLDQPYISGATELGNGRVVLILDARALILSARKKRAEKAESWED
ncbi:MAG: chemotaxis protein CheA [Acidobacteriota bacterium]